jgi:hypothetical protein
MVRAKVIRFNPDSAVGGNVERQPGRFTVRSFERRAFRSEAMGLCLGTARKPSFLNERPRKTRAANQAPKTH